DQNLTFTLLKDYIWAVDDYGNTLTINEYLAPTGLARHLGIEEIPKKKADFLGYSFTYWRTHGAFLLPLSNTAKRNNVNVFFHHNDRTYPLYESGQSKWSIDLEVRKLSGVRRAISRN
ncbi:MAG: hypothetical protein LBL50_00995, partial [Candidatus Margulisbacteria bacterium]|nr:hypothetical protein [Candidatus Margulisiibacteriota bacterium]